MEVGCCSVRKLTLTFWFHLLDEKSFVSLYFLKPFFLAKFLNIL